MNSSGSKGNPKSGKPVNTRGSAIGKGDLRQIYDKLYLDEFCYDKLRLRRSFFGICVLVFNERMQGDATNT
jgi:hypothetical protein